MQPDKPTVDYATPQHARTSPLLVALAWFIVGVPAAWGVSQTFTRSLQLFTAPPTPAATQPDSK